MGKIFGILYVRPRMTRGVFSTSALLASLFFVTPLLGREHTIASGDTIAKIARHYGVGQKQLMSLNNIDQPGSLHVGDILMIPEGLAGNARRKHIVREGDTLSLIAKRYRVSRRELRELNRIAKGEVLSIGRTLAIPNLAGDPGPEPAIEVPPPTASPVSAPEWAGGVKGLVRSGEAVEGGVRHTVQPGQTIAMIAWAYNIDAQRLIRQYRVSERSPLKAGQVIIIPDARRPVPVRTNAYRPHPIDIVRIKNTKRLKLTLVNRGGNVNQQSRTLLSRMLGYRRMHPRLVLLIEKVAERFPGHPIEIISGYRKPKKHMRGKSTSPHARGVAVDFRLHGVSNELLYEFVSALDNVGAGYYPNALHVHLDVRKKKYLWTDVSGQGEPALYVNPGDPDHWDAIQDTVEEESVAPATEE